MYSNELDSANSMYHVTLCSVDLFVSSFQLRLFFVITFLVFHMCFDNVMISLALQYVL